MAPAQLFPAKRTHGLPWRISTFFARAKAIHALDEIDYLSTKEVERIPEDGPHRHAGNRITSWVDKFIDLKNYSSLGGEQRGHVVPFDFYRADTKEDDDHQAGGMSDQDD